ncbi:MAG: polyprenyl synthetase family protein [Chloroflexi bacterium]|nr:polyprenyl synthetase family protein [Chloroflexota bacterium]
MLAAERKRLLEAEQLTLTGIHDYLVGGLARRESVSHTLREACLYAVGPQGKMIRPALMLEACRSVGGNPEQILPAVAGTEYGHTASLIHDDLIDGDSIRRGQEAVHRRFGVDYAILGGDYLIFQTYLCFTRCYELGVSSDRVVRAIRILSETCLDMCEGQALEVELAGNCRMTQQQYMAVIHRKTATFTSSAAEIGGVLGGGTESQMQALRQYGIQLGLAFQITDDILPYIEDPSTLRKPADSDLANRRVTLPIIYALQLCAPEERAWIEALFSVRHPDVQEHERLAQLVRRCGAANRALDDARRASYEATRQVEQLPHTPSRDLLSALADLAVERHR